MIKLENTEGYKKLMEAVKHDCIKGNNCFNPNGCDKIGRTKKCFHNYCDTFKWVLERVKHYSEKTGIPEYRILDNWELNRDYWYQSYYQDANQPLIQGNSVRIFDTIKEFKDSLKGKGFRCPNCNGISTKFSECDVGEKCDWKAYGLFRAMGKGITVFIKENLGMQEIFMPVAWEEEFIEHSEKVKK